MACFVFYDPHLCKVVEGLLAIIYTHDLEVLCRRLCTSLKEALHIATFRLRVRRKMNPCPSQEGLLEVHPGWCEATSGSRSFMHGSTVRALILVPLRSGQGP